LTMPGAPPATSEEDWWPSFGIAAGRRLPVAMLLVLSVSVPAGSRAAGTSSGPPGSRDGRIPGSRPLRPTDGNADPEGHGYSFPSRSPRPHVCVHWVTATSDAPPLTDTNHNQVRSGGPDAERVRDRMARRVIRVGSAAPSIRARLTTVPTTSSSVLADVARRLSGTWPPTIRTRTTTAYQYHTSTYIVVDDDFSTSQLGASGGLGGLRATAAHEFSMPAVRVMTRARTRG
jgi:hypothetical protein